MSLAKAALLGGLAVALGWTAAGRLPSGLKRPPAHEATPLSAGSHPFELSLVGPADRGLAPGDPKRELRLRLLRTAWVNLDLIWAGALIVTAIATVVL